MKIIWLGHSCFKLINSYGKSIITDPYDNYVGYNFPDNIDADIVTISHYHKDHCNLNALSKYNKLIDNCDTVCYDGFTIKGINIAHDYFNGKQRGFCNIYEIESDGLNICHMGDIGYYSKDISDKLNYIDILFIPIGGNYTISAKEACKYIDDIQPIIVVPMHYKTNDCAFDIDNLDVFLSYNKNNKKYIDNNFITIDHNTVNLIDKPQINILKKN